MTITHNDILWGEHNLDAPFLCIYLKSTGQPRLLGKLCWPPLELGGDVRSNETLYAAVRRAGGEAIVISSPIPGTETFVWKGTPEEFEQTWIGD